MNFDDIKSPLPARKVELPAEDVATNQASTGETGPTGAKFTEQDRVIIGEIKKSADENKKKYLVYGGIGLVAVLLLVVIVKIILPMFGGKGGSAKEVTLNYWGLWENNSIIESVIADFEAKNPGIKINYKMNSKMDYRTRLAGRLAKGADAGEEVPDIFRIHNSWVPMMRENLAEVPAATATNIGLDADFYDAYKQDIKQKGQYLGVPLMYDGLSLFYNKDLVDAAQIDVPKSWWSLKTAATKLTVKDETGIKVAGVALGLTDNVDHWSDILGLMMKQNGVSFTSTEKANMDKIKDILVFYTQFKTESQVWDETLPSSTEMFASGKLGFYFAPSWRVFNIEEANPDLKFEITTVPQLPTLSDIAPDQLDNEANLTNIHWSTYWFEGVNKNSKHQKEAWLFLEYLASKEGLEKMYEAAKQVRSFGEIYPRKSMGEAISSNAKIKPFVVAANEASGGYLSSRTFDNGLNDDMAKYFGDAINAIVIQKADPESTVMPALQNGMSQVIQKYKLKANSN